MENKDYADFLGGANKVYYGECGSGESTDSILFGQKNSVLLIGQIKNPSILPNI